MKKFIVAFALVLGTMTVSAQTEPVTQQKTVQQTEKEIAVSDVPSAVTEAVKTKYPDAQISTVKVNGNNEYTLTLTTNGQSQNVYADANGKWIKRD